MNYNVLLGRITLGTSHLLEVMRVGANWGKVIKFYLAKRGRSPKF